ncbi:MAG: hypothetical protein ABW026_19195 [Microvirga sp.]
MPLYYLHVKTSHGTEIDPTGMDLPDLDAARAEALKIAGELLQDWPTGWPEAHYDMIIEVVDRSGQTRMMVPFSEATYFAHSHLWKTDTARPKFKSPKGRS